VADHQRLLAEFTAPDGEFALEHREVRGVPMRVHRTGPQTLRDVLLASREYGEAEFTVYERQRRTFTEHFHLAAGLAHALLGEFGLRRGDRVAIAMRNYPEWAPIFFAAQAAGLIAVPLNAWWSGAELRYGLADSGAKVLFADDERVAALGGDLGGLQVVQVRGTAPEGVRSWEDVLAGLDPFAEPPEVAVDPDDDATIMYTSGTTGRPKGAVGTHRNHCTNLWNIVLGRRISAVLSGAEPAEHPGVLLTFPLFHIAGLSALCFAALAGAKAVTMYRWNAATAAELVRAERLTSIAGVPTVLRDLAESEPGELSTLDGVSMGGAPIPPDLVGRVRRSLSAELAPANGYGLTETTSAVVTNSGEEYVANPDSVGRLVPGAELRVVDPATGEDVPEGEVGELWFRGPQIVRGYWNNPAATEEAFGGGWFRTGDLGRVRDGLVHVVDRMKDVVLRGGENVYCAEVEAALFEHPAVADAAVLGVPDEALGERVVAVVQLHGPASEQDLREHVAARLAAFKVPDRIHPRAEVPRNATGKVRKKDLRCELAP